MTKIIGLTGGIGSGKTTVAKAFEALGVPVYIADDEAKKIMLLPQVLDSIKSIFSDAVFDNGVLNRQKLAQIVFENPQKLKALNDIVHPFVKLDFENWVQKRLDFPFVIKEAAILFESGSYIYCNKIITVIAPLETRIKRVMDRDKTDYESVLKRISNQWTDEMRAEKSDYIIENIDKEYTLKQVYEIFNLLKD